MYKYLKRALKKCSTGGQHDHHVKSKNTATEADDQGSFSDSVAYVKTEQSWKPDTTNDEGRLCVKCAKIDLDDNVPCEVPYHGKHICYLGSTDLEWADPSCCFCKVLKAVSPSSSVANDRDDLNLYLFPSSRRPWTYRYGGNLFGIIRTQDKGNTERISNCLDQTGVVCIRNLLDTHQQHDSIQKTTLKIIDSSRVDFSHLRRWIAKCKESHESYCSRPTTSTVPSLRLIDCETREIEKAVPGTEYIALSYVWGHSARTDVPDTEAHCLSEHLPATIEDAIVATKRLGFQYLWIDRYCISQDDDEDRHHQIQQMDLIYRGAELVIVAAAGDNPDFGLPGVRNTSRLPLSRAAVGRYILAVLSSPPQSLIRSSKWASRGWTYQEGLLARRRLFFTEQLAYFECHGMNCYETTDAELERSSDFLFIPLTRNRWEISSIIGTYSGKELSYQSDALNAILGVLRVFETEMCIYHYLGVPILCDEEVVSKQKTDLFKAGFVIGLSWSCKEPGQRRAGFPSWSWAGWTGTIDELRLEHNRKYLKPYDIVLSVVFEGIPIAWANFWMDKRGKVGMVDIPQHLYITAHCLDVRLSWVPEKDQSSGYFEVQHALIPGCEFTGHPELLLDIDNDPVLPVNIEKLVMKAISIATYLGEDDWCTYTLLVIQTGATWERIGLWGTDASMMAQWHVKESLLLG